MLYEVITQVKRILIIHQGALGDFILSLPAISAFRHHYPDTTIEIWGYPEILRLVDRSVYADTIHSIDRERIASLFTRDTLVITSYSIHYTKLYDRDKP